MPTLAYTTGLVGRFRASSLAGSLADGDPVGTWSNEGTTGGSASQATAGFKPTFVAALSNGRSAVRFDASDDRMTTPVSISSGSFAIFACYLYGGGTAVSRIVNGGGANWLLGPYGGVAQVYNGSFINSGVTVNVGDGVIHGVVVDGTGTYQYVENVLHGSNAGTTVPGTLGLGAQGMFADPMGADLIELLVYDHAPDATARGQIQTYLDAVRDGTAPTIAQTAPYANAAFTLSVTFRDDGTHDATEYTIYESDGTTLVYGPNVDSTNLTSRTFTSAEGLAADEYVVKVRTRADGATYSAYSTLRVYASAGAPQAFSGLAFWYDASRITGVSDGAALSTWSDLSGNGINLGQGNASFRPTYQATGWASTPALPAVYAHGSATTTRGMAASLALPSMTGYAFTAACENFSAASSQFVVKLTGSAYEINFYLHLGGKVGFNQTPTNFSSTYTPATNERMILSWVHTGTTVKIRVNGTEVGSHSYSAPSAITGVTFSDQFLDNRVGEMVLYSEPRSDAELSALEGRLGDKWGVTVAGGGGVPDAPTGIAATSTRPPRQITVTWDAVADATGYEVHLSTTSGFTPDEDTLYATVGAVTTATIINARPTPIILPSTTYYAKVVATNASGSSSPSSEASTTTPANCPPTVATLRIAGITSKTVTLAMDPFVDTDGDGHAASQWRLAHDAAITVNVRDSGWDTVNLLEYTFDGLERNVIYYAVARTQDDIPPFNSDPNAPSTPPCGS